MTAKNLFMHAVVRCVCGAPLNGAQSVDGDADNRFTPGCYIICGHCGAAFMCIMDASTTSGHSFQHVADADLPADIAECSKNARAGKLPPNIVRPSGRRSWP